MFNSADEPQLYIDVTDINKDSASFQCSWGGDEAVDLVWQVNGKDIDGTDVGGDTSTSEINITWADLGLSSGDEVEVTCSSEIEDDMEGVYVFISQVVDVPEDNSIDDEESSDVTEDNSVSALP